MYNRKYYRKTIITKQEDGLNGGTKSSVVTLEIKNGRGKITIQDKNLVHNQIYFITYKNGTNYYVELGATGSVFDADNIYNTGLAVENFDVIAIGRKDFINSLDEEAYVGYSNNKRDWKRNLKKAEKEFFETRESKPVEISKESLAELEKEMIVPKEKNNIKNNVIQKENKVSVKENIKEAIQENIKIIETRKEPKNSNLIPLEEIIVKEDDEKTENIHETFKRIVESFKDEMAQMENFSAVSINDLMANVNGISKKEEKAIVLAENKVNQEAIKNSAKQSELEYIFNNNEKLNPFDDEKEWARICVDELWGLDLDDYSIIQTSFVILADKKYNHLLLGREGENSLILAVPDKYNENMRKNAMKMGFFEFLGIDNNDKNEENYGYWLKNLK